LSYFGVFWFAFGLVTRIAGIEHAEAFNFYVGDGFFFTENNNFLKWTRKKGENINVQGTHKKDNIKGRTIPEKTILFYVIKIYKP